MSVVVTVIGPPGSGKSTLCATLARRLVSVGMVVDHFEEQDILTRAAFSAVAEQFADGDGAVSPDALVDAFGRYVSEGVATGVDVMLTDALAPFVPSLLAWGHSESELEQILPQLEHSVAEVRVIVILLSGDPAAMLLRAASREGGDWASWYVNKLSAQPGTRSVVSLAGAADNLRREDAVTRRLLSRSGWDLIDIDAVGDPERIAGLAQHRLDDLLSLPPIA